MGINSNDIISRLMLSHVISELRSYKVPLARAVHISTNRWLPDVRDPVMAQHIETLGDYLAAEEDIYLLRLGLTVPGMLRGIAPPLLVLEPNRGGFSERRQREAARQISCLREALALGRQFLPNLNPDTESAIAELAELPQLQSRPDDEEWLKWFNELSDAETRRLTAQAIQCFESGEKSVRRVGERVLQHITCYRQPPLPDETCLELVNREVFSPSSLYRESGERTAEQLVKSIERADDRDSLNLRLLALAWTRSDVAERSFRAWEKQPPMWAEMLYVRPVEYLLSAGWCLDENGRARDLVPPRCFRLRPAIEDESEVVHARTELDDDCPTCGLRLVSLFDFSHAEMAFRDFQMAGAPMMILCCLNCACHGPVFARYVADGTATLISATEEARLVNASDFPAAPRLLSPIPCPSFVFAEPFSLNDASTLGGVPMWLQDPQYPRCIECDCYMSFLAQHDDSPLGGEGIYYAFYCAQCRTSAVVYQQT